MKPMMMNKKDMAKMMKEDKTDKKKGIKEKSPKDKKLDKKKGFGKY